MPTPTSSRPSVSPIKALERAVALHRAEKFADAITVYALVLQAQPSHAEALRLRGLALDALGRTDEALASLRAAIAADPKSAEAHYTLGNVLLARAQPQPAIESFRAALRLMPKFTDAWCNLGTALAGTENWLEATKAYEAAVRFAPKNAMLRSNLSAAYRQLGRTVEAIAAARRALQLDPKFAGAANNLAIALQAAGLRDESIAEYRRAIELDSGRFDAHFNLAILFHEGARHEEAVDALRRALALNPQHAAALLTLGLSLQELARTAEACEAYRACVAQNPKEARAWNNLGVLLQAQSLHSEAVEAFQRLAALDGAPHILLNLSTSLMALKRLGDAEDVARRLTASHPEYAAGWSNLGSVLNRQHRVAEAEEACRRAIQLDPNCAEAHNNLANALMSLGRYDDAIPCYDRALAANPNHAIVNINAAMANLTFGNLAAGWPKYEYRLDAAPAPEKARFHHLRRWKRKVPLVGETLVVHAEQGLGDTIQFARYLPLVADLGGEIVFEVQSSLQSLLEKLDPRVRVIPAKETVADATLYCPLLSLPGEFETTLSTIPPMVPIAPANSKLEAWNPRVKRTVATHRVGVVWCGNPSHANDANRSLPFTTIRRVFEQAREIQFYSLQKNPTPADAAAMVSVPNLDNIGPEFADFSDTAAVVSQLDVVIAVDTSVAHLAATMGKPVWLLLPFAPDWRWMLERSDTPWYPSMTLYRQSKIGDWSAPLDQIVEQLSRRIVSAAA